MPAARLSAEILKRLSGLAEVRVFARLKSTNLKAAELLEAGELELPAAVLASSQTAGAGRGSNTWYSDAGSLTATWVFPAAAESAETLPLRVGLALRRAIGAFAPMDRLMVKWPNDLLADGRKLAGILCKRCAGAEVIGIGVNVSTNLGRAPAPVRRRATTIAELSAKPPTRAEVFVAVSRALAAELASPAGDWWAEINRCNALAGKAVAVDVGGGEIVRGVCREINRRGRLVLDDGRTVHRVTSGTVLPES